MRILCVGGGPAGLYFAILMKQHDPRHDITVFERNPPGLTYGWGVVFWNDLLASLYANDSQTAGDIGENSFRWIDQVVHVQGKQSARLGGYGYGYSISRRRLLDIFTKRAMELGVGVQFEHEVEDPSELADGDLVIACDGVNSRLRRLNADRFKTDVKVKRNKYIWLGTSKVFDAFTFAFVKTVAGWIWFHAYGFNSDTSTCIVECSPETWTGLGFDKRGADESIALLQRIFERHLDGHPLMSQACNVNGTPWLNFHGVTNERWYHNRIVLMGDAAHTTHFTIGSGTRLALEDAIVLAAKLHEHQSVQLALKAYQRERQFALLLPQRQARNSAQFFEKMARYIDLETSQFATLLRRRRSRLLPYISPKIYYHLCRAAGKAE